MNARSAPAKRVTFFKRNKETLFEQVFVPQLLHAAFRISSPSLLVTACGSCFEVGGFRGQEKHVTVKKLFLHVPGGRGLRLNLQVIALFPVSFRG